MRVGLRTVRVHHPAHKAQLLAEWSQRFGRFAEYELRTGYGWKPTPLVDAVVGIRQRHTVGCVNSAETARNLVCHFGTHGVENRQSQRNAHAFQESAAVELKGTIHGFLLIPYSVTFQERSYYLLRTESYPSSGSRQPSASIRPVSSSQVHCMSASGPLHTSPYASRR